MSMLQVYALASRRDFRLADRFLSTCCRGFEESQHAYVFPDGSEKARQILYSAADLIDRLVHVQTATYEIDWENPGLRRHPLPHLPRPQGGRLVFTEDGGMIGGLLFPDEELRREPVRSRDDLQASILVAMAGALDAGYALVFERLRPAFSTRADFLQQVDESTGPKVKKGRLVPAED